MRHTEERYISLLTDSLKAYRDIKNSLDSAEEKGERKKAIEIARVILQST